MSSAEMSEISNATFRASGNGGVAIDEKISGSVHGRCFLVQVRLKVTTPEDLTDLAISLGPGAGESLTALLLNPPASIEAGTFTWRFDPGEHCEADNDILLHGFTPGSAWELDIVVQRDPDAVVGVIP